MNPSDEEEGEILQYHVTDYHFEDENRQLISVAALPLWNEEEANHCLQSVQVYLCGDANNGLQKIYKLVVAWKFDLSCVQPEILVFSKEKSWLTLQRPRNAYLSTIAVTLITIHWLHFLKRNPEASRDTIWNHLQKFTSSLDIKPSESDLSDHEMLISEAVKRDKDLSTHQDAIMSREKPWLLPPLYQRTFQFLNDKGEDDDDDDICEQLETSESIFDPVCAICDNGGSVLCCEGRCLRSFHPTKDDGKDSACDSLGFADNSEVDAVAEFLCKNCQYKQHQCYICGKLGSSDPSSQEVFPCVSATCGHYYHPDCVAKWLFTNNKSQAEKLAKEIRAGESFTCPVHQCSFCKKTENPEVHDQQFAVCRRCPKSYHRKCLPKDITFNSELNCTQRAWEGLLNFNRILIYCLEHEIVESLVTPMRNHLVFPGCKKIQKSDSLFSSRKACASPEKFLSRTVVPNAVVMRRSKSPSKHSTYVERNASHRVKKTFGHSSRELNLGDSPMKSLVGTSSSDHQKGFRRNEGRLMSSKMKYQQVPAADERASNLVIGKKVTARIQAPVNEKMEQRCLAIIKEAESLINAEEFMKNRRVSTASTHNSNFSVDKSITMGRVEASVKAVQAALQMLEAGGSVEDAKSVCGPEVIRQILAWKAKLSIYLAPFLHGARYTSFGRHFTKVDKLREIIDRLHWYVQNGDTIVDFCCGSNDFSCLLKEKLEQTSKSCSFKNYDLFRPKNDFNFEKRDWMSVEVGELPEGSQMIMGLNPPFGYKASLANQFIDKALKFRPKLLVLIVPAETRRVDKKASYDLIWEEDQLLSQKSFYLPGSFDANEKHLEQWNMKTPPLYVWSRQDWTARHMEIARERGHLHNGQGQMVTNARETMSSAEPMVTAAQEHNWGQMPVSDEQSFKSAGHTGEHGGDLRKAEMTSHSKDDTMIFNYMEEEDQPDYWPDFSGSMDAGGGGILDHAALDHEHQNLWDIGGPLFDRNNYTWQSGNQYLEAEKIETTAATTPSYGVAPQGEEEDMCIDMDISPSSSQSKQGDDVSTVTLMSGRPSVNLGFKQAYHSGK